MSEIRTQPLDDNLSFGARVTGIGWDNVKQPEVRSQINGLLVKYGVLVFSGVESTSEFQVELSSIFGPLRNHVMANVPRADVGAAATLMELASSPEQHDEYEVDGMRLSGVTPWHTDACYSPEIYRGGLLRALELPPEGGLTGFADGIQLYQAISPDLREKFESLNIIYDASLMHDRQRFGIPDGYRIVHTTPTTRAVVDSYKGGPRAIHPAIWQRDTGERVLHVSPWQAAGIEGHEDPEGDAVLEALCQEIYEKMEPYWHKWQLDDMVVWDNWRMLHAVSGHDPAYARRIHRATIEGDYGMGRPEVQETTESA